MRMAQSLPFSPSINRSVPSAEIKLSLDLIRNFSVIKLRQWSSAFDNFLGNRHNLKDTDQRAVQILRLHRVMMKLTLTVSYVRLGDEMIWDEYSQDFKTLVSQAEEIIQSSSADNKQPSFTLDTEVIMPLFFVAIKCRHSDLRWKAIALLRSTYRQEGICWNSPITADVAERLVRIEEEGFDGALGATTSIPRLSRVLDVEVGLDAQEKRASLNYVKLREDSGIERVNEWIEWSG